MRCSRESDGGPNAGQLLGDVVQAALAPEMRMPFVVQMVLKSRTPWR